MSILAILLITILFGVVIAVILGAAFVRRRQSPDHPSCGGCGYNVSASIDKVRCPECGAMFAEVGILPPRRGPRTSLQLLVVTGVLVGGCLATGLVATLFGYRQAAAARQQAVLAQQLAPVTQSADAAAADAEAPVAEETEPADDEESDVDED